MYYIILAADVFSLADWVFNLAANGKSPQASQTQKARSSRRVANPTSWDVKGSSFHVGIDGDSDARQLLGSLLAASSRLKKKSFEVKELDTATGTFEIVFSDPITFRGAVSAVRRKLHGSTLKDADWFVDGFGDDHGLGGNDDAAQCGSAAADEDHRMFSNCFQSTSAPQWYRYRYYKICVSKRGSRLLLGVDTDSALGGSATRENALKIGGGAQFNLPWRGVQIPQLTRSISFDP